MALLDRFNADKGRWKNTVAHSLGLIMVFMGSALLIPLAASFYYEENYLMFLIPMAFVIPVGLLISLAFKEDKEGMQATSGILMIGGAFLIMLMVGSTPYMIYGMDILDTLFESMSGITTTGYTMVRDFDTFPQSLFLWRSLTQWIGGVSVILIFLYMLPIMGLGGKGFFINEMSGSGTKNFSVRLKDSAKSFLLIYVLITIVQFILLMIFGVNGIDSACMTLSTVSTGGFMNNADSLADYSALIKSIVVVFMFIGGTNFYLHFKGFYKGQIKPYVNNTEFRWTIYWYTGIAVLISVLLINFNHIVSSGDIMKTFGDVIFTVISMGTTTGFSVIDITDPAVWPMPLCTMLLLIVAFIGGMSGSTAGGVKMYRFVIIGKYIKNSIYKTLHPMAVYDVKMDGGSVEETSVINAFVAIALFALTLVIASVIFMINGMLPEDSVGLAITSVCNTGAAVSNYGPIDGMYMLNPIVKIVMIIVMFLGRLEIALALLFFMPGFWKEVFRSGGKRSRRVSNRKINMKGRMDNY